MALWAIVELTISTVGTYNLVKGVYNMYRDAEEIKTQYRQHQHTAEQYRRAQTGHSLTESQYDRYEGEFMILNKSMIIDPYQPPDRGGSKLNNTSI